MRKIVFFAIAMISFAFFSCDHVKVASSSDSSAAQKNLDAHHKISKAFETGDVTGLDSVVADDFTDHTEKGVVKSRDSLISMIKWSHENMKDMKMNTVKELADDEYVMGWMKFTGTGDGTMMPAGPYEMNTIEVSRYRDGKAVEHWAFMSTDEMMKMMQSMGSMQGGAMPKSDTVKVKK